MGELHSPSDSLKWKRHHKYKSLRSFTDTNVDGPDVQPSKSTRGSLRAIDPLKPCQENIISKKQPSRPLSGVRFFDDVSELKGGQEEWRRYNVDRKIVMSNNSIFKDWDSELDRRVLSAIQKYKGGSSGLRSTGSSGSGSGGGSGGSSGGGSGDGSGGTSGGGSGGSSIFSWRSWSSIIWSNSDPVNEAIFKSKLTIADYSRLTKKIGAIARPATVNLCYLNAGIQALAATRFVHFVDRTDQITPIAGGGHGLVPITERIANAFRSVNQWYHAGFSGSLANRVAAGRVHQTPMPDTIGMGMLPFIDTASGFTPMCDITEFLDSIIGSLDDEYLGELQTFHDLGASGWVDLAHTLDHFTRIALVESEACISCNLIDLYKINKRAQRLLKASAKGETDATSETSKKISADIIEIDRRLLAIEQGLRRKLTNDRIPVDDNGRLRGINMRSEAMTPRSPRSETQAISRLPNTIILGYNIVHSDTMKKNRTQLKIPQVLSFASWTADITDGNHSRDPLRPLRPKGSKYNDGIEFECRAISYHHGETTNSGHYFTDRLPWIPNPRDVAAGAAPREPYEWWFCNEYITDMFAADQPFPRPSGAKEQEVLVVYERIMDPADKAAIILPSADTTRLFDFNREYQFSEYSIPAGGPVVFKNEQNMEGKSSPRLDLSKWTKITGFFGGVGTRSSKRVRVHDYENEDISISSAVEIMETRPPKRARVAKHEVGAGWGLRSTRGAGHEPNVERERRKAMENLHDSSLIRHPEVLADFEQKKKWRMGGSHGGDFIIPPSPDASNSSIDSGSNDRNRQRKNSPGKRNRIQKVPSSNSITPIYVVHEDEPEGCYRMEYVEKASSSNHPISERAKGKRPAYRY
ncbi:hypothetical protein TWF102_007729 [Orbilia oligospora]|uniref:Peptidase C19 ubiquitin carboxyl-terminal hydrolase domain-containing protein n=1 Tax=Orbilia oligospora TaxID=2813651 RepID=A0A7C8NBG0_ORBOL|nr:hypothetical protein TWF102_007729 [Orbilia oligospora]